MYGIAKPTPPVPPYHLNRNANVSSFNPSAFQVSSGQAQHTQQIQRPSYGNSTYSTLGPQQIQQIGSPSGVNPSHTLNYSMGYPGAGSYPVYGNAHPSLSGSRGTQWTNDSSYNGEPTDRGLNSSSQDRKIDIILIVCAFACLLLLMWWLNRKAAKDQQSSGNPRDGTINGPHGTNTSNEDWLSAAKGGRSPTQNVNSYQTEGTEQETGHREAKHSAPEPLLRRQQQKLDQQSETLATLQRLMQDCQQKLKTSEERFALLEQSQIAKEYETNEIWDQLENHNRFMRNGIRLISEKGRLQPEALAKLLHPEANMPKPDGTNCTKPQH